MANNKATCTACPNKYLLGIISFYTTTHKKSWHLLRDLTFRPFRLFVWIDRWLQLHKAEQDKHAKRTARFPDNGAYGGKADILIQTSNYQCHFWPLRGASGGVMVSKLD